MNKKILLALLMLLSVLGSRAQSAPSFQALADSMAQALITHFWGASFPGYPDRYYFNYGSDLSDLSTGNYWPEAHAIDVITDVYLRTGDQRYSALFPLWWQGAPRYNFAHDGQRPWWNPFVDDMEWITLAQIRMFEATGDTTYIHRARQIYDDWIWSTWGPDDEAPWHGGITWKTDVSKSKNACSNGPAAIIAAKLAKLYHRAGFNQGKSQRTYLTEAKAIYAWLRANLFDHETGAVYDNMNSKGHISRATFTYNSGTFIGAAHQLYQLTGDKRYLGDAIRAANYVIQQKSDNFGVPDDAVRGDGGLFHGIFFRYFAPLAKEPSLSQATRDHFRNYLLYCAKVVAQQGVNPRTHLYGGRWRQAPGDHEPVCLTAHLTGCMLIEAACTLQ